MRGSLQVHIKEIDATWEIWLAQPTLDMPSHEGVTEPIKKLTPSYCRETVRRQHASDVSSLLVPSLSDHIGLLLNRLPFRNAQFAGLNIQGQALA